MDCGSKDESDGGRIDRRRETAASMHARRGHGHLSGKLRA